MSVQSRQGMDQSTISLTQQNWVSVRRRKKSELVKNDFKTYQVAWNSAETDKRIPNIIQLMKKNVLQKSNESGKCQVQVQQVNDSRKV